MSEICLTILCPPMVEEKLLDLLLMSAHISIFTSTTLAAHGLDPKKLDQAEQVLGRARATQIQMVLAEASKEALLASLHQQFRGVRMRYWITPVLAAGEIE